MLDMGCPGAVAGVPAPVLDGFCLDPHRDDRRLGAGPPLALVAHRGTALAPLAAQVGPIVRACGVVVVVLLFGMSSIHASFGLFNLVNERLPSRSHAVVMLSRRRDRLLLRPRGSSAERLYAGLTYLGLTESVPLCRLDMQCDGRRCRLSQASFPSSCWPPAAARGNMCQA